MPLTLTEKLQEAFPESCKPLILITDVPAVAVIAGVVTTEPAEQEIGDSPFGVLTAKPVGSVSEKLISLRAVEFGLVKVNVKVLAFPRPIEVGEKLLESVGTKGRGQPLITMLSRYTVEVAFASFRVSAWMVNRVVLVPVVAAVAVAPVCHDPFVVGMVVAEENAPPFALE